MCCYQLITDSVGVYEGQANVSMQYLGMLHTPTTSSGSSSGITAANVGAAPPTKISAASLRSRSRAKATSTGANHANDASNPVSVRSPTPKATLQVTSYSLIHTYLHTSVFNSKYTYIHSCIQYKRILTYIHTYIHTYMYTSVLSHIYIHTYIHTYIHKSLHTFVFIYIYTSCIHTYVFIS
jgi:hypothetical protein